MAISSQLAVHRTTLAIGQGINLNLKKLHAPRGEKHGSVLAQLRHLPDIFGFSTTSQHDLVTCRPHIRGLLSSQNATILLFLFIVN